MPPKPKRYIELVDDIRNHVLQWATDTDWGRLPPKVNVALTMLMNEIRVASALKESGINDVSEETIAQEKKNFVSVFKRLYLECVDFDFKEPITPINQVNISRVIEDLKNEGGSYVEFLEWFFLDFCSIESNKQKYMPPQINLMCSNFIVSKYLFKMKDELKVRKNMLEDQDARTTMLDIALPMSKRLKSKEFQKKILDLDNHVISVSKFFELMKAFAKKFNDEEAINACKKIDAEIEEKKSAKKP